MTAKKQLWMMDEVFGTTKEDLMSERMRKEMRLTKDEGVSNWEKQV